VLCMLVRNLDMMLLVVNVIFFLLLRILSVCDIGGVFFFRVVILFLGIEFVYNVI